jgi:hypothetical protein
MNTLRSAAAALAAATLALPAGAILTRPDRDDEEYRELATRYPSAVSLGESVGTGVVIAPRWILTAAHVIGALPGDRASLRIGGRAHAVQEIVVHPDWKAGGESDIALIHLREPVQGIEPTLVHRQSDEKGRAVRIVGFGESGRIGGQAAPRPDGKARAAVNTVDRVDPFSLGVDIKPPEEASDLQGAAAPGDGGAPAFFEIEGRILVAGIFAATVDANGDGIRGNVGDRERYTRASAFAAWIDAVLAKAAAEEAAAAVGDVERR